MADANNDQNRSTGTSTQQVQPRSGATSQQNRAIEPSRQQQGLSRTTSAFSLMRRMMSDMDRLFGSWGALSPTFDDFTSPFQSIERSLWSPQVDVFERGEELVVHADLPGLRQDDVKVNVDQGVLTISGQRSQEESRKDQKGNVYHSERSFGSFQRSIVLPDGTDTDQIRASFENGVLEVTAPLPKQAQQRGREVPIGPKASAGPKH